MYSAIFSERMKREMDIRGWTKEYVAVASELPLETIRSIYYGKTKDLKLTTALKIADVFGLSVNCMVGKCPHTTPERTLIHNYRSCGKHGKSIIEQIAKYEASAVKIEREGKGKHKIPCIVPHGDVHKGIIYELCETVEIETSVDAAYIAIQMTNNVFAPVYCKGDILLFENRFPDQGEKAAFYNKDRIYIRKFLEEDGRYRLKCLHQYDDDIVVKRMDDIEYIGTCIGVIRE